MKFSIPVAMIAMALVTAVSAKAETSSWPMFRHDVRHTGRTAFSGPAVPTVKWVFTAQDGIVSSPARSADGTIYVGAGWNMFGSTDSSLYAINSDGSLKWCFTVDEGVFSSPAIGPDGTIYFGSLDEYFYAVEDSVTYGKLKWRADLGSPVFSSPVVGADGTIYVGSLNFNLYAIRPNGTFKWAYPTGWCVFSSPAIGPDGAIYFGSKDEHLYVLEDSLTYCKLRWKYATGQFYDGHLVDSSPAIGPDGTLYVGTDPYGAYGKTPVPVDTVFFAVKPDGSLKWKFAMEDGAESSPAIGPDGTIYVGSYDGNLYAIRDEGSAGVLEWSFPTRGPVDGSPTVDGCGTIYFGSRDSTLYALNPDGTLRWAFPAGAGIECSPTIDENGILYVGTFDGSLYAFGGGGPDVGVLSIDVPGEVQTSHQYIPSAHVRNYRSGYQSFYVSCVIDSAGQRVYGDTLFVSQLPETTTSETVFAPWTVGADSGIVYTLAVVALLGGDDNQFNDTLTTQSRATTDSIGGPGGESQGRFSLGQCRPNPFSTATAFAFSIRERVRVSLKVFNVAGQLVRVLLNEEMSPGTYTTVMWDGHDGGGTPVPPGVYLYQFTAGSYVETRKAVVLR
ncbi:MAG: PQQ-binding-like beta-propeller repeat protein [Candidatus Eisenbacteria bacterium]